MYYQNDGELKIDSFIPALGVKTVHVWKLTLPQPVDIMKRFQSSLSVDELSRVKKFHFKPQKIEFIAARGGLRSLLAFYLDQKPEEICFCYTEYGKPYLENTDLNFSISHSGNYIVYAFTRGACLGIDVEEMKDNIDFLSTGKLVFSEQEYAKFLTVSERERALTFYRSWTRKEAYTKAIGTGLYFPLAEVEVSFLPNEKPKLLKVGGTLNQENTWELKEIILNEKTVVAITTERVGDQFFLWDLERHLRR